MKKKTVGERERLIDEYDFSFLLERFLDECPLSKDKSVETIIELKRFFKLVLHENKPLAIIDKRADALWHTFILFTPSYFDFCEKVMGFYVHHQPKTSSTLVPTEAIPNFVKAYNKKFGSLGSFWFETLDFDMLNVVNGKLNHQFINSKWSGWIGKEKNLELIFSLHP